jgi:hypothetical protein
VLKQHDAQLARLESAVEQAPRPYHLVVLSDHGQTQGRPFRQRYGVDLPDLVKGALAHGEVFAPEAADEGLTSLGGALTDARDEDTAGARVLARATRDQLVDGEVVLGPNREAIEAAESGPAAEHDAIVLASGGLGLVSLPERDHRMKREEIDSLHPELLKTLTGHPGIGFVMVDSEADGPIVIGGAGSRRLRDDAVTRTDPLEHFDPTAADHLRRTHGFAHCPDILVNCTFDPETQECAPFEEFMGSHGGLGGWQTHPFALVPTDWSEPAGPIVGVRAMHDALRGWLRESGQRVAPHAASD